MADLSPHERKYLVGLRIACALQEAGILLFVFTPLDFYFHSDALSVTTLTVAGLMVVAILLFTLGVLGERRIHDAD